MGYDDYSGWRPYMSVAQRRRQAARAVAALKKQGRTVDPVSIEGRKIARTFWGKAWCDNLESYSDYANRLPRGRTYVRNGSVIDLQINRGQVTALVSGSSIYDVAISIKAAAKDRWRALAGKCAGKIDSVVELLQGKFSKGVMEILARRNTGLFPSPREISLTCSCPDWATMCKHVAAVLYGIGARLDHVPEMLFVLRDIDHMDLVAQAGSAGALAAITGAAKGQILDADGLSDIFGIDIDEALPPGVAATKKTKRRGTKTRIVSGGKTIRTKQRASAKNVVTKQNAKSLSAAGKRSTRSSEGSTDRSKGRSRASKRRSRRITARELIGLGVPRSTFQNWVTSGVLVRTQERGVYRTTSVAEQRVEAHTTGHRNTAQNEM